MLFKVNKALRTGQRIVEGIHWMRADMNRSFGELRKNTVILVPGPLVIQQKKRIVISYTLLQRI